MNILIAGENSLGLRLAKYLVEEKHTVTIIDYSTDLIDVSIKNSLFNIVQGDNMSLDILATANINNVDCVIAITNDDYKNLVICKLADCLYTVPVAISVIRDKFLLTHENFGVFAKKNFSIDYPVNYWNQVYSYISMIATVDGIFDCVDLSNLVVITTICREKADVLNTPFTHLSEVLDDINIIVLMLNRNGSPVDIQSGTMLEAGDEVTFVVEKVFIYKIMAAFGYSGQMSTSWNIFCNADKQNALIEKLQQVLKEVCVYDISYQNIDILDFDKTRPSLILGDNCELNTVLALSLKKKTGQRVIVENDFLNYMNLLVPAQDFVSLSYNNIIFNAVISNIYSGGFNVIKYYDYGRIIEILVTEEYPWIGTYLKNLYIKNDIIPLCLTNKNGENKIAHKNDIISINDKVTLFVTEKGLKKIKRTILKM